MTEVVDLSPGTVLVAGTTGWQYVVVWNDGEQVGVRGPRGMLSPISHSDLQQDIAHGAVGVIGWGSSHFVAERK